MAGPWQAPPRRPRLHAGELHVWRAELEGARDDAHGILRALLGRYLGADSQALELAAGAHGKPAIAGSPLRFNLSHSGRLAMYAFALGAEVGVDLEVAVERRRRDEAALAARAFGAAEAERLGALDAPLREREFLRAWVRHEAVLKCRGTGFAGVKGGSAAGADAAGGADAAAGVDVGELWIAELDVGPRAAAAVALDGPAPALALWRWGGWSSRPGARPAGPRRSPRRSGP